MWGAASMTMPMVHRDIDPYEKSIYILVCSLATEANLTGIQGVFPYWRVMDFRRWPGPDEPESQMFNIT